MPFVQAILAAVGVRKPPAVNIPRVPALTAKRATDLYGVPDGDPHGAWAKEHIVYCGGGGKAELPAMPGVPGHLWYAIHRRAEPKMREGYRRAHLACPEYVVESAGGWVYRHQRWDTPAKAAAEHRATRPLSNHSWGAADDANAGDNRGVQFDRGKQPALFSAAWWKVWPHGFPQAWIEAFLSVGGIGWGGAWSGFLDPMHREVYDPEG